MVGLLFFLARACVRARVRLCPFRSFVCLSRLFVTISVCLCVSASAAMSLLFHFSSSFSPLFILFLCCLLFVLARFTFQPCAAGGWEVTDWTEDPAFPDERYVFSDESSSADSDEDEEDEENEGEAEDEATTDMPPDDDDDDKLDQEALLAKYAKLRELHHQQQLQKQQQQHQPPHPHSHQQHQQQQHKEHAAEHAAKRRKVSFCCSLSFKF